MNRLNKQLQSIIAQMLKISYKNYFRGSIDSWQKRNVIGYPLDWKLTQHAFNLRVNLFPTNGSHTILNF